MPRKAGSVYQRKDGRWVAAVTIDGKVVTRYAKTEREAELKLLDILPAPTRPEEITLAAWIRRWLHLPAGTIRVSTLETYHRHLTIIAEAPVGCRLLAEVTPLEIASTFASLRETRGGRVLSNTWATLRYCLSTAVETGLIAENPMAHLKNRLRWTKVERRYWTPEQSQRVLEVALTSRTSIRYPLFALLLTAGLRVGEALALDWSRVDLDQRRLTVVATSYQLPGGEWATNPPKSRSSRRTIALSAKAMEALHLMRPKPSGPVFATRTGKPICRSRLCDAMKRLCAEAEVPYLNLHGLRHGHAMLALTATQDMHAVQRRLGADEGTTMRLYVHTTRNDAQAAATQERAATVEARAAAAEHLVRITALKKLVARGKLPAVYRWVEDFLAGSDDGKLVVFAHHQEIVAAIAGFFNAPTVTGDTPQAQRQANVDRFQTDPACRLIVLNMQAGGVGLTLTAASDVAFTELGWNPAVHDQAEDRCHRIGQRDAVTAWYLLGADTLDEEIAALIEAKRGVVTAVNSGAEVGEETSILKDLVASLRRKADA